MVIINRCMVCMCVGVCVCMVSVHTLCMCMCMCSVCVGDMCVAHTFASACDQHDRKRAIQRKTGAPHLIDRNMENHTTFQGQNTSL